MTSGAIPEIPDAEHVERLGRLQRRVAEAGLDVFVVTAMDSVHYLTGAVYDPLERPFFLFVRPARPPSLLVPTLEREHLRRARGVRPEDIATYWDYPAPAGRGFPEGLARALEGAARVGVEPSIPHGIARLVGPDAVALPLVEELRLVKSPAEIALIRRAARYADHGVERIFAVTYPGSSVAESFSESRAVLTKILREVPDCDLLATKVIAGTWAAPRSAEPHSIPRLDERLGGDGPHVALVVVRVNGYTAECERTLFTAAPRASIKALFDTMMEARRRAFALIRPGLPCGELDAAVNAFLAAEGHDGHRLHRTGHGFGLGNHEGPWIAEGSTDVLAENMVVSVEPGIYVPDVGGVRHSDTVLVTARGCESLTRHPTDYASMLVTHGRPSARIRGFVVRRMLGIG